MDEELLIKGKKYPETQEEYYRQVDEWL